MSAADVVFEIWRLAGAQASRAFDADGLPLWGRHPEHGWHHASASACDLAEEAGPYFSLPEFDAWLSALPPCPMKSELLERRARALELVKRDVLERLPEVYHELLVRHFEFMLGRWHQDARDQVVLPLARKTKRQADLNRVSASRARSHPALTDAIKQARALQGSAKVQWQYMIRVLTSKGYSVREYSTGKGGPACEIQFPEGLRKITLKTFANQKSR